MTQPDAVSIIFEIVLKTGFLLFFLSCLKFLFKRLAKTNQPAFKEAEQFFEKLYWPLSFVIISFSLIYGTCSVYRVETFGWLPLIAVLLFIAVSLIVVSIYRLGKAPNSSENRFVLPKF